MSIKQSIARISNSSNALITLSAITVVASAVAAKSNKPKLAVSLVGLSTALQAREVHVRHTNATAVIQNILMKSKEVSELDVPAHIVASMKAKS
jgi:hypothetical protein